MKNNLLLEEEIEKIKRLSGLNEAAPGPNQAIAKLITTIQSTPVSDDVIREFEVLANGGKISINKSSKKITSIIWKDLSDDEVKLLFKSQEISDIFKKILNDNNIATDPTAIALYSPNLKKIIKGYEDAKNLPKISGGSSAGGSAGSNAMSDPIDSIINRLDDIKVDDIDINEILRRNATNPRFQEFRVILNNIPMSDEVKNMMLAGYDVIGKDPVKAIEYASKLQKSLNEKQYGWVKKGISHAAKNPIKTITILGKTIAAGTFWGITAFAIFCLGGIAIGWIKWAEQVAPKAPSLDNQGGYQTGGDASQFNPNN